MDLCIPGNKYLMWCPLLSQWNYQFAYIVHGYNYYNYLWKINIPFGIIQMWWAWAFELNFPQQLIASYSQMEFEIPLKFD